MFYMNIGSRNAWGSKTPFKFLNRKFSVIREILIGEFFNTFIYMSLFTGPLDESLKKFVARNLIFTETLACVKLLFERHNCLDFLTSVISVTTCSIFKKNGA